jgi:predicted Zn-dependent peptidase
MPVVINLIGAAMNGEGGLLSRTFAASEGPVLLPTFSSEALLTGGALYVSFITGPDGEQRARGAALTAIERFAARGLSAEELASARAVGAEGKAALLQSQAARALEYAREIFAKHPPEGVDAYGERIRNVTAEEVKRVASQYLKAGNAAAGVVRGNSSTGR